MGAAYSAPVAADLSSGTVFSRAPDILDARVGDVLVLHDPNADSYVRLNASAAMIWDELRHPAGLCELVDALARRGGLGGADARREVEHFLEALLQRGVVVRQERE
jgi:coenzyme PQQ synthesis protein D (PqqD)